MESKTNPGEEEHAMEAVEKLKIEISGNNN
jgi:hypothetical protein